MYINLILIDDSFIFTDNFSLSLCVTTSERTTFQKRETTIVLRQTRLTCQIRKVNPRLNKKPEKISLAPSHLKVIHF
jgi:hypothetical protein